MRWEIVELDVNDEVFGNARSVLTPDEIARASRFLREADRRHFTVARAALRRTLAREIGIDPREVGFRYGAHGKPAIDDAAGLRFNLSHAGGRALIAWTRAGEIGVDIENVRPVRFGEKIARRYFSDDERRAFDGLSGERWDDAFFRCWTRKEAFIKAIGDGLAYPLRSFSVPMERSAFGVDVRVHEDDVASKRWRLLTIDAGPGFAAAIVTERAGSPASS